MDIGKLRVGLALLVVLDTVVVLGTSCTSDSGVYQGLAQIPEVLVREDAAEADEDRSGDSYVLHINTCRLQHYCFNTTLELSPVSSWHSKMLKYRCTELVHHRDQCFICYQQWQFNCWLTELQLSYSFALKFLHKL